MTILTQSVLQAIDDNGQPLPGALLYSYGAGTTNPQPLFLDSTRVTQATNPVVADAAGRFPALYMSTSIYRIVVRTADGAPISDHDNVANGSLELLPDVVKAANQVESDKQAVEALAAQTKSDALIASQAKTASEGLIAAFPVDATPYKTQADLPTGASAPTTLSRAYVYADTDPAKNGLYFFDPADATPTWNADGSDLNNRLATEESETVTLKAEQATQDAKITEVENKQATFDNALDIVASDFLPNGDAIELGLRDPSRRYNFVVTNLGDAWISKRDRTGIERVPDAVERAVETKAEVDTRIKSGPLNFDELGNAWFLSMQDPNNRILGIISVSDGEYKLNADLLPITAGPTVYAFDAATSAHAPASPFYALAIDWSGQSNHFGQNSDAADNLVYSAAFVDALTDGSKDYMKMPSIGLRPQGAEFTTLAQSAEDLNTADTRESGLVSFQHHLHRRIFDTTGVRQMIVGAVMADPGEPMSNLMRGSVNYERASRTKSGLNKGIATLGLKPLDVEVMMQGEAAEGLEISPGKAKSQRRAYYQQKADDAQAIYGLKLERYHFDSYVNAGVPKSPWEAGYDPKEAPVALTELQREAGPFRGGAPVYSFEHSSDELHLSCTGQAKRGATMAEIVFQQLFGIGWEGFYPISKKWISDTVCEVQFVAPSYPLVLDTSGAVVNVTGMVSNLGFEASSRSGEAAMSAPIVGTSGNGVANLVRFTFTNPVTEDIELRYAQRMDSGGNNGPTAGGRGVLRANDGFTYLPDASTLYHWCPAFTFNLGRP